MLVGDSVGGSANHQASVVTNRIRNVERDIGEEDWSGSEAQKVSHGLKLAFTDIKMYVLMVLVTCCVASGSITNFFPIVVQTLGFGKIETLLLTTPPYVSYPRSGA